MPIALLYVYDDIIEHLCQIKNLNNANNLL